MKTFLAMALMAFAAFAQTPQTQYTLTASPPAPVPGGGGHVVGTQGQSPIYYWVIARYPAGTSVALGPILVNNTVGVPNLSTSNYVALSWTGVTGATGYDVLRNSTSQYPANPTCAACAVAVNTTATGINDQGTSTAAYPNGAPGPAPSATVTWSINNRDLDVPYVSVLTNYGGTAIASAWIQYVISAPSGSCSNGAFPLRYVIGTSNVYACSGGTWQLISGSGGGGVDCGSTGILVQTAASTYVCRTITAGSGIDVTNGSGVSGNPTIAVSSVPVTSLAGCKVTVATAVGTIASPCNFDSGGVFFQLTSDATFTLSGTSATGTVYVYWDDSGNLTADQSTLATLTCNAYCTSATTGGFPVNSWPIATVAFTSNVMSTVTDMRAAWNNKVVLCGTGLTCTRDSNGRLTVDPDTTVLETVSAAQTNSNTYALIASGSGTTYTCNPSPAYASLTNGAGVRCKVDITSTGASTLNVSSLGAKKAYKYNGTSDPAQITTGELRANVVYTFLYDTSLDGGSGGWITSIGGGGASTAVRTYTWAPAENSGSVYPPPGTIMPGSNAFTIGAAASSGTYYTPNFQSTHNAGVNSEVVFRTRLPAKWDGSAITFVLNTSSNGTAAQVAVFDVSLFCVAPPSATVFPAITWGTADPQNMTIPSGTDKGVDLTFTPSTSGCSAGNYLYIRLRRLGSNGSDTDTGTQYSSMLTMVWTETIP